MSEHSKHTPLPWRYERANPSPTTGEHLIAGGKPGYLAEVRDCGSGDVAANAALIVRAVNCHSDLLEALKAIVAGLSFGDDEGLVEYAEPMIAARAALAKAEAQ